ncbi:hypothetical protein BN137_307 [Cronobacter condimenti 1330]|uniref:Uncharacterized protein n=2 Tax=Cronobacter condimenti TaxID=1163710 RepID=K8A9L8_9ENTR|nr:hypothetical protein BN137_307 [Cronobacter condimenti 1330]
MLSMKQRAGKVFKVSSFRSQTGTTRRLFQAVAKATGLFHHEKNGVARHRGHGISHLQRSKS